MPTWPASLPQNPLIGMTGGDDDAVLRTSMDTGPATRRNRFTAITQSVSFPMVLTGTQRVTFETFYRTTLSHGALSFDWDDPVDDATVSMAFKSPPKWSVVVGDDTPADRVWRATFEMEILP